MIQENLISNPRFTPRQDHSSIVQNNNIYIIGGRNQNKLLNDIYKSTDGLRWELVNINPELPFFKPRAAHCSVEFQNNIYVIAGFKNFDQNLVHTDVWSTKNGSDDSWELLTDKLSIGLNYLGHYCFTKNNTLFMLNKQTNLFVSLHGNVRHYLHEIDIQSSLDGKNWDKFLTNLNFPFPTIISSLTSSNISNDIFMTLMISKEYYEQAQNHFQTSEIEVFNALYITKDVSFWKLIEVNSPQGVRYGFSTVFYKGDLQIIGGYDEHGNMYNDSQCQNQVFWRVVNIEKVNTFNNVIRMKFGLRSNHTSVVFSDGIINIGGYNNFKIPFLNQVIKKDLLADVCSIKKQIQQQQQQQLGIGPRPRQLG